MTQDSPHPIAARSTHRRSRGIPLGYLRYEFKRPFRRSSLIFTLALPMILYVALFRTGPQGADLPHGNFAMWMTIGIALGLTLRPEVVMHIPGLTITAFAFIGNLFIPLSGTMLSIGQVTPMFGVATIARYALTDGYTFSGEHSSLGWAVFNALAWLIGFIFWASRRFARSTGRM